MIPTLQSRCGRHSCAMQRVVPTGAYPRIAGTNPPAHLIILTGAKQAAEPRRAGRRRRNIARADLSRSAGIADKAACNVVDRLGCPVAPGSVHHGTLHYLQFANLGPGIPFLFFIFTPH